MPIATPSRRAASRATSSPTRVILKAVALIASATAVRSASCGSDVDDGAHDARARDADVDDRVGLAGPVDRAGHERVVLDHVGEDHELRAADAVAVGGGLGGRLDRLAPCAATASMLMPARVVATLTEAQTRSVAASACGIESMRRRSPVADALVHERREAADEVDADLGCGPVERRGERRDVAAPCTPPRAGRSG